MSNPQNDLLSNILQRLEKITEEVVENQGYTAETEVLKMLVELTREQVKNENFDS